MSVSPAYQNELSELLVSSKEVDLKKNVLAALMAVPLEAIQW
jgi:hypothetical protein